MLVLILSPNEKKPLAGTKTVAVEVSVWMTNHKAPAAPNLSVSNTKTRRKDMLGSESERARERHEQV